MRRYLLATAMALALTAPAKADLITLGGQTWNTAGETDLTLTQVPNPTVQPTNNPCIICGTNQPNQPTGFGFNNYIQNGNETSFIEFSTATVGGSLLQDTVGTGYSVSFLQAFLASRSTTNFSIGIDVNTATGSGPEVLEAFALLDLTTHTVLAQYSLLQPGGTALPTIANGSGFPDYLLSGFDINLASIAGDNLVFYSRWSNTSDGAESFFLVPSAAVAVPGPVAGAGFPGIVAGCVFLWGLAMKRRRRNQAHA
jgi:hypothetical protein